MGDFNQILNPSESSIGSTRITKGISDFRDYLLYAGLSDLSFRGHTFTWWNNKEANPIAKKLDRILVNDNWLLDLPNAYAEFGDPLVSDHRPCCLILSSHTKPKRCFKVSHFLF